jgi:uncharacterized OsmC-like protein
MPEGRQSAVASRFSVHVEQVDGFRFLVNFDKPTFEPLRLDEPPPLGRDTAPNAARILAAAVGNCLSASLVFCLQKAGVTATGIAADVGVEIIRNEARRLRIGKIDVALRTKLPSEHPALVACLRSFEDFCLVTQSVRQGIEVAVHVESEGKAELMNAKES